MPVESRVGCRIVVREGGVAFSDFVHNSVYYTLVIKLLVLFGELDNMLLPFFMT